ncbi:unnamed protein product [Caenorhabditis sp. 36 PRJEB53466]|nr:unnamed protein product [Caenorhabditis sp. 36 PRJEB53466]
MFVFVEFVSRPRKYKIHDLFVPVTNFWLPQLIYFCQTAIKNTMFLGYVVVAVNRFTVIFSPKLHNQIWTPTIISLIYALEWCAPSTVLVHIFYNTGNHNFSFLPSSNGGLSLRADADFMKLDALQDFILCSASFSLSSTLYIATIVYLVKNVNLSDSQALTRSVNLKKRRISVPSTEFIILKCALFSFLLFVPNAVKTGVLYFATAPDVLNLATDLWYFTTELMSVSSCWSLLLSSHRLRHEFFPKIYISFGGSSSVGGTTSGNGRT